MLVFSEVTSLDKIANRQSDLNKIYKWSGDWQKLLNAEKCKYLYIDHKNACANYCVGGIEVMCNSFERHLVVVID